MSKLIVFAVLVLACGSIWFLLYSELFRIKNIEVNGAGNISSDEVKQKVFERLNASGTKFIRSDNIFLFDTQALTSDLNQFYNFEYLKISKNFPERIKVAYTTRQQAYVLLESNIFYYLDNKGNIINETNPADQNIKNFYLVENQGIQKVREKQLDNIADILNFISGVGNAFKDKKIGNLAIEKFIIDSNLHSVKLKVVNGPSILFNVNGDINSQLDKLTLLIKDKLKNDFNKKQYIDIRFGDMIYYQ